MTDDLADIQEAATDLIDRIESALATLDLMAAQARDNIDISTGMDVNNLERALGKLERTEDAWSKAIQIIDGEQQLADARDQSGQVDPAIRAKFDATGQCPSGDTGSMYANPYAPAVQ